MTLYHHRPTATLQARRAHLLTLPRNWSTDEQTEMRAIESELTVRNVLSIGLNF